MKKDQADRDLSAEECSELFKKISKEEADILGFSNNSSPKDMIIKLLLVMPP